MDCDDCHLDCYLNDDESSYDIGIDDSDRVDCTADIRRAVNVNNGGTELLRDRRYQAAVKSFTSVLTILKPLAAIVEGNIATNGNDGNGYYHSNDSNNSDSGNPASSMPLSMNFAAGSSSGSGNDGETSRRHHRHQEGPVDNDSGDIDMTDAASAAATRRSSLSSDNNKRKKDEGERAESLPVTSSSPSATKRLNASSSPPLAKKRLGYFVFRDPVEIPIESVPRTVSIPIAPTADPQDGSDGLSSSDLFSKFIMIVMYNLALTLHLQAIEADDGDCAEHNSKTGGRRSGINRRARRLFARARKLYELAFEMHLDESCEDVNLLFTLALINNLGLIYDRTGETSRSETCFGNMLSTMMYLTDSNESSNVKQWDGLLSNVMDILFFKKKVMYEVAAPAA